MKKKRFQTKLVYVNYSPSCFQCNNWGKCTSEVCRKACLSADEYAKKLNIK